MEFSEIAGAAPQVQWGTLAEWFLGGIFVGFNAYRRYNTPIGSHIKVSGHALGTNRESTTFQNFVIYFIFYLSSILLIYVFCGAVFDSSPEVVVAILKMFSPDMPLPDLSNFSAPMVSALIITTMVPAIPYLKDYDAALIQLFWDRGHIPHHVQKMAAAMRRAPFNFSPRQIKQLKSRCKSLHLSYDDLLLDAGMNLDYRWARINVLLESIEEWKQDDVGRLRRFMLLHQDDLNTLFELRDEINSEFLEIKNESLEDHIQARIERFLERSIAVLLRDSTIFVAKAICIVELSESGRRSRVSQLGFEGGTKGFEGLSGRQFTLALLAILSTFLVLSVIQELVEDPQHINLGRIGFLTFLMLFTYGVALVIALKLKRLVGMGYNELTRQRSWIAYLAVGIITAMSWGIVSFSYRYILKMFSGIGSGENLELVLRDIGWSFPYALQSLALAVAVSWILDYHQSNGITGKLTLSQRFFDVGVMMASLGAFSAIAYCWMDGIGWFELYATRELDYRTGSPLSAEWLVVKGMAVGAVVGWLVPMWFYLNRSKAPDQIAGRLIAMNKKGLSREIRNLEPNELIKAIAAVSASVSAIDHDVSRSEIDVYQIICSHLAGLASSDVDIDSAEKEFDHCLTLIDQDELQLETRLRKFNGLPLLESLMPYVATSIAFADGVYLEQEQAIVEQVKEFAEAPKSVVGQIGGVGAN